MTDSTSLPSAHPAPDSAPPSTTSTIPDMLVALGVDPLVGLKRAQVEARRTECGNRKIAEQRNTPCAGFPAAVGCSVMAFLWPAQMYGEGQLRLRVHRAPVPLRPAPLMLPCSSAGPRHRPTGGSGAASPPSSAV